MTAPVARATNAIALLTCAAFVLSLLSGRGDALDLMAGFIPARLLGVHIPDALPLWVTPLTATLLHGGGLHLGFNMLILLFCGRMVEAVLGWRGASLLYILGAYTAAVGQYLLDPASLSPMIGASGAISALFGAYALLFSKPRLLIDQPQLAVVINIIWLALAWVGVQFLMGFAFSDMGMAIAVGAHIGGFITGLAVAPALVVLRGRQAG